MSLHERLLLVALGLVLSPLAFAQPSGRQLQPQIRIFGAPAARM